jgi:hypothetical protein
MSSIQYTIRGVSEQLDAHIRSLAAKERKSLNETVLELMRAGAGLTEGEARHSDLDDLAGTWVHDPEFDHALEEMDQVDPDLWQ